MAIVKALLLLLLLLLPQSEICRGYDQCLISSTTPFTPTGSLIPATQQLMHWTPSPCLLAGP
jgi:hypothetical protein